MGVTTIRLDTAVRDRLARIARTDYQGESLGGALERLIDEHEMATAIAAVERYRREDPAGWADYQTELAEWDGLTADGLDDTRPGLLEGGR